MNHIFLVGFMGSGKTSTGKRLAKELKMQHADLDTFIESRYCKSIQQLFTEKGETEFREIERKEHCAKWLNTKNCSFDRRGCCLLFR